MVGDWGGQQSKPYTTLGQLETAQRGLPKVTNQLAAEFILALGDNFYDTGIQSDVNDHRFKKTFEDVYTDATLRALPWFVVAGNHDHKGNVTAQVEYTKLSKRWKMPGMWYNVRSSFLNPRGENTTVEVIMGDSIMLLGQTAEEAEHDQLRASNDHQPVGPKDLEMAQLQLEWLYRTLETSDADFLFIGSV